MNFYVYLPFFCLYVNKNVSVCLTACVCFFQQCELFRIIIETIVLKEAFDACVNLLSSCSDFHTLIPLNPTRSLWLSRIYRFRLDSNKNMHVRVECVCVGVTALDLTALCLMNAYPPPPLERLPSWNHEPSNVGKWQYIDVLTVTHIHTHTHTL